MVRKYNFGVAVLAIAMLAGAPAVGATKKPEPAYQSCASAVLAKSAAISINTGRRSPTNSEKTKITRCLNSRAYWDLDFYSKTLFCASAGRAWVYARTDGCQNRGESIATASPDWNVKGRSGLRNLLTYVDLSNWNDFAYSDSGAELVSMLKKAVANHAPQWSFLGDLRESDWFFNNAWPAREGMILEAFDPATYATGLETIGLQVRKTAVQQGLSMTDAEVSAAAELIGRTNYEWHIEDSELLR